VTAEKDETHRGKYLTERAMESVMKEAQADALLLNIVNTMQVAVLASETADASEAAGHFANIAKLIPAELQQPHLSVLRSVLFLHVARWAKHAAPHAQSAVIDAASAMVTADVSRLAETYLTAVSVVGAALNNTRAGQRHTGFDTRVAQALGYVRSHCTDHPLRLDDVARSVHVSRWHLERLIKKQTGRRFKLHVRGARLEAACELLELSTLSVKEIAARIGYPHVSELTRDFKAAFRVPPRQWRLGQR
jgi:AraC-like DNA-binding protein